MSTSVMGRDSRLWRRVAGGTLIALLLAACGGGTGDGTDAETGDGANEADAEEPSAVADGTPVTLEFQEFYAPGQAYGDATAAFGEAVTEMTGGSVDFEYHWSNALVPYGEVLPALSDGLLDVARFTPTLSTAETPVLNWWGRFAHMTHPTLPAGMLQGIAAQAEMAMTTPEFTEEVERNGVHLLGVFQLVTAFDMLCREPAESQDDLRNRRVRTPGEAWTQTAEALGMEAVSLAGDELYEAYQRGIIDCLISYPQVYIDMGLGDIGGHHIPVQLTGWNDMIGMNQSTWDDLSDEQRDALRLGLRSWLETYVEDVMDGYWEFIHETPDNIELLDVSPELQGAVDDHHAQVREDASNSAPPSVEDPDALMARSQELHDKWHDILVDLGYDVGEPGGDWFEGALADDSQRPELDLDPWLDRLMEEVYGLS